MAQYVPPVAGQQYSDLREYFLARLERILQLRRDRSHKLNQEGLRLLDRSIFSTYIDCIDQGIQGDVQKMILDYQEYRIGKQAVTSSQ